MSTTGGDEAAQAAVQEALADAPAGSDASAQTEGQIENPHAGHVDSWHGTKQDDGSVEISKGHTYDDPNDERND